MYKNLIRCLFFALLLSGYVSQAQTGAISGTIKDAENKEELIGVTVLLQGPNKGAATDVEGKFVFNTIPVGVYSLKITYVGL
jgi:hypothetical protein